MTTFDRKRWREIRKALPGALKVEPSEAFVRSVMAGVEAVTSPRPAGVPFAPRPWVLRIPGWVYPELGLAAAALLVMLLHSFQLHQTPVSTEALLLGRLSQEDRWVASREDA